jgi:hypothetical protein
VAKPFSFLAFPVSAFSKTVQKCLVLVTSWCTRSWIFAFSGSSPAAVEAHCQLGGKHNKKCNHDPVWLCAAIRKSRAEAR